MLQLYKNIKNRRIELHLTQSDLASKMGYADKSMIAKIEKGLVDLPQSKIFAFAKVLETTPSELMGWEQTNSFETQNSVKYPTQEQKELNVIYEELPSQLRKRLFAYSKALQKLKEMDEEIDAAIAAVPDTAEELERLYPPVKPKLNQLEKSEDESDVG